MGRQILIDAARTEGVHRLIVAQLLHKLGVATRIAAERRQKHQRRPRARRPQRNERRPRFSSLLERARHRGRAAASRRLLADDESAPFRFGERRDAGPFHQLGHRQREIEPAFEVVLELQRQQRIETEGAERLIGFQAVRLRRP